jgi:hypothetical protein
LEICANLCAGAFEKDMEMFGDLRQFVICANLCAGAFEKAMEMFGDLRQFVICANLCTGAFEKAMEMFGDLRQFDEAKKWAEEYSRTKGDTAQVEW